MASEIPDKHIKAVNSGAIRFLLGDTTKDEFFTKYWEKKPLVIKVRCAAGRSRGTEHMPG